MNWEKELSKQKKTAIFKYESLLLDLTEHILIYKNEHSFSDETLAKHLGLSRMGLNRILKTQMKLTVKEVVELLNKIGYDLTIKKAK